MSDDAITLSTRLTRADVAGLIEALTEGLKEGCLKVQKSDACLSLEVPRVVDLEIWAGTEEERSVFRIDVSWRTVKPRIPDVDMPDDCSQGAAVAAPEKKKPGKTARTAAKARVAAKTRKTTKKTA